MPNAPDPRLPGRYAATSEDGAVYVWCQDHPDQPLAAVPEFDSEAERAIREHDRAEHGEDPVV